MPCETMPLTIGAQLGSHEITALLGKGGMGEVYRARDTKLKREVAIKILPEEFSRDADRVSRFQREAEVLASLNHPNIAAIHEFEETKGTRYLVLELVEGETLADRIARGSIPVDEALIIAKQICDALEAAHEKGIIHRDLKPSNIKTAHDGTVKVLDFGLAKALGDIDGKSDMSSLPTTIGATTPGVILGTPAYMSPEQARGTRADERTDIWAFGCILFEMLTGRRAFDGETATDSVAKVVAAPPNWSLLAADTPAYVRSLLAVALEKDPKRRLKHIGDARIFLDPALATTPSETAVAARVNRWPWLAVGILAATLLFALVSGILYFRAGHPTPAEMKLEIPTPGILSNSQLSVSPDGRYVAYWAFSPAGNGSLWVRPLNSETPQELPGTGDVVGNISGGPFWSPDSRYLAFASNRRLKKIEVPGGLPQELCDVSGSTLRGGAWNRDGLILFGNTIDNVIVRVSDSGGKFSPVTTLDATRKETAHTTPQFLPDGRHFLYVSTSSAPGQSALVLGSLDSKDTIRLMEVAPDSRIQYSLQGYVLLNSAGNLTALRFDASRLSISGQPAPLADGVGNLAFSASDTGTLVFHKDTGAPVFSTAKQLLWFDRKGVPMGEVTLPQEATAYRDVELSPNGDRVALGITVKGNEDIWVIDVARSVATRITNDPENDWSPSWLPDASRILFTRAAPRAVFQKSSLGIGAEELVIGPSAAINVGAVSSSTHDGRYAIVSLRSTGDPGFNTWMVPLSDDRKPVLVVKTAFQKLQARVSPDQRWIAYMSNESDGNQIFVHPFPDATRDRRQVTAKGGSEPKWRGDSRELYYIAPDGKLMAVPIKPGATFDWGEPVVLFQTPLTGQTQNRRYDVTADGERFLVAAPTGATNASARASVIINWTSSVEGKQSSRQN
jgi:serine/threonine protein kinase